MKKVVLLMALSAIGGCAWFDDGSPSRSCKTNRDCFAAQGEVCNADGVCEVTDAAAAAPLEVPQ